MYNEYVSKGDLSVKNPIFLKGGIFEIAAPRARPPPSDIGPLFP